MRLSPAEMAAAAGGADGTALAALAAAGTLPDFAAAALALHDVAPLPGAPLLTLVSRRNKRLILNEAELVAAARARGLAVRVAVLEDLPLFELVALLRRTAILAGMHGSALINSAFMAPGAALLQLLPFKVDAGSAFFEGAANARGVAYHEWRNTRLEDAVFHWHFLGNDYPPERREAMLREGSQCCGDVAFFSFWIQQDTRVHPGEFGQLLDVVLAAQARAGAQRSGAPAESAMAPAQVVAAAEVAATAAERADERRSKPR
jgi:hypothetical protein